VVLIPLQVSKDARGQETLTPTGDANLLRPGEPPSWTATAIDDLTRGVGTFALSMRLPAHTTDPAVC
jgi:hypothetical protein